MKHEINQLNPEQTIATERSVASELSGEGLRNLAGYFDVLIQMDLASKLRNEIRSKNNEENGIQSSSNKSA